MALFSRPKHRAGKYRHKTMVVLEDEKNAPLASLQRTINQVRFRRASKKANPREAHNQRRTKNCTTIVVLPSPRSHFGTIELRLDCRFPSTVRQRNQSRLKQTITASIQAKSIRQDDADVNSLSACTKSSAGLIQEFLQIPSKYALKSLINLLLASCRSLVVLLWISCSSLVVLL